jgi:hypothetical protein
LDLVEYYNFGLGHISIRGHLENSKNLHFKALRISLRVSKFKLHPRKYELPWKFVITLKET